MKQFLFCALLFITSNIAATNIDITSPNGQLKVNIELNAIGEIKYSAQLAGTTIIKQSPLGLETNIGNFISDLTLIEQSTSSIDTTYTLSRSKFSSVHYIANSTTCFFVNKKQQKMSITFNVSNNDIEFRYTIYRHKDTGSIRINKELTGFTFPNQTTAFLTPQSDAMIGWKRTKPSYEEEYIIDAPISTKSSYGHGWTFPCLFKIGSDGWALISETGVDSRYCASHLSDCNENTFTIEFAMPEENNGNGTIEPAMSLPGNTPWRTITIGKDLKPIVETTAPWNNVEQLYESEYKYPMGRGTWSWILWQDNSINYDDQVKFIDLAHSLGLEFTLIDNWWDTKIGHERMEDLIKYAHSQNVEPIIWYSSSGYWNDIEQGPTNIMDNPISRKKEMRWLKANGVRGIKVDFFGGDKQETMRLYEAILSDADDNGIMVIFHGCTLPRGWERMFPNYAGSEAVLASENMIFSQHFCDKEAQSACLHPFIRNTVGSMEYGGCFLNKRMNKDNNGGNIRRTSDIFQLATTILFQNSIQHFAIAPNNLIDAPKYCLDFLSSVPTTWDETQFIDGYPSKYVILARRNNDCWYIAGVNATDKDISVDINLPFDSQEATLYSDKNDGPQQIKIKNKKYKVTISPNGGIIIKK